MGKEPAYLEAGKGANFRVERNERRQGTPVNRASLVGVSELGMVVESVLRAGAYISFGSTTDGGALLIRILDGPDKLSSYCHTDKELLEALEALTDRYGDKLPNG